MDVDLSPIVNAAIALLAVVIATLQPVIVRYIKARLALVELQVHENGNDFLRTLAYEAVSAAERLGNTPADKKEMAVNYVVRELSERGMTVSPEVISQTIEAVLSVQRGVFAKG